MISFGYTVARLRVSGRAVRSYVVCRNPNTRFLLNLKGLTTPFKVLNGIFASLFFDVVVAIYAEQRIYRAQPRVRITITYCDEPLQTFLRGRTGTTGYIDSTRPLAGINAAKKLGPNLLGAAFG